MAHHRKQIPLSRSMILILGTALWSVGCARNTREDKGTAEETPAANIQLSKEISHLNLLAAAPKDAGEAALLYQRIEGRETTDASLGAMLEFTNARLGQTFSATAMRLTDDMNLLTSRYRRYVQTTTGAEDTTVDVDGTSLRVWSDLRTGRLILAEAYLSGVPHADLALAASNPAAGAFADGGAERAARADMAPLFARGQVLGTTTTTLVKPTRTAALGIRRVTLRTKGGTWQLDYAASSGKLVAKTFRESPRSDGPGRSPGGSGSAYALPAMAYPLWELPKGTPDIDGPATPTRVDLSNILDSVPQVSFGSALSASAFVFRESLRKTGQLTPAQILGGYWNNDLLNFLFPDPWNSLAPHGSNLPGSGSSLRLYGRNVVVMLHPKVADHFAGAAAPAPSFSNAPKFVPQYDSASSTSGEDESSDTVIRYAPLRWGQPINTTDDLLQRSPYASDGLPYPDRTADLIRSGFDEAQVYFATDDFLSTFRRIGFQDPELSTRPFVAILFDPDIESRDNAYYTDNTINFATYSPGEMNMARDNTTIWHELGHALQDRLMGPHLDSAEGYGLWEGMADFLAQLIIADHYGLDSFTQRGTLRILNRTHFYLTNESHDEGEAYGGAMNTMLESLMGHFGRREGLLRMADLTLETMRLTRDHPRLTAAIWFEQMKYVDTLARDVAGFERQPGDLRAFIDDALASRNYAAGQRPASFEVTFANDGKVLRDRGPGSRGEPIPLDPKGASVQSFALRVKLSDGDNYRYRFPVTVKVTATGSPLQGAIHWDGEEQGPWTYVINGPDEALDLTIGADTTKCDFVNSSNGGCRDYVHIQLFDAGSVTSGTDAKPIGKKRFYLSLPPVP